MPVKVVGVLNCTPDSFSDGGLYFTPERAADQFQQLINEGVEIVEVGGDSTRPESLCPDLEEEWRRIRPIVTLGSKQAEVWVDTHRGEIARRAIAEGVRCINDISGGADPTLLEAAAQSGVRCVLMYSTSGRPHEFAPDPSHNAIVDLVKTGLSAIRSRALSFGLKPEAIVLDTGMGAFLGSDPELSWEILRAYPQFFELGHDMLLGCSRKGFLRTPTEKSAADRDVASAFVAGFTALKIPSDRVLYIRAHNATLHLDVLRLQEKPS